MKQVQAYVDVDEDAGMGAEVRWRAHMWKQT